MPKITIREIDNTGAETNEYLDYTVFIPGEVIQGWKGTKEEPELISLKEGLYEDLDSFEKAIQKVIDAIYPGEIHNTWYDDQGYLMARECLNKGLSVYYVPLYCTITEGTTKGERMYSKDDGKSFTIEEKDFDWSVFFKEYSDKGKYDLRFITCGCISFESAMQACIKCAGDRADAVALLSIPEEGQLPNSGLESGETRLEKIKGTADIELWIKTWFNGVCASNVTRKGVTWTEVRSETYGRYASIFGPVCTYPLYNEITKKTVPFKMPAAFDYLICFATYINRYPAWYAVSGSIRGVSPYSYVNPSILFGDADVDILQVRSGEENKGHVATNVICNIRPYGNIVWGNRTMNPLSKPQNGTDDAAYQLTASSFLNIRQLCCSIKKTLYRAARKLTFEPNSDSLWFSFLSSITPLLDNMKSNQGIKGYKVIRENTKKKAVFVAHIKIVPIEAVEDFDLTVSLEDSIEVAEE